MADAKVTFDRLTEPGSLPGQEQVFGFRCPVKGHRCEGLIIAGRTSAPRDGQNQNGGTAQWDFDGNREAPTFAPSINCGGCKWHGFIEKGRTVDCQKKDEPEPKDRPS